MLKLNIWIYIFGCDLLWVVLLSVLDKSSFVLGWHTLYMSGFINISFYSVSTRVIEWIPFGMNRAFQNNDDLCCYNVLLSKYFAFCLILSHSKQYLIWQLPRTGTILSLEYYTHLPIISTPIYSNTQLPSHALSSTLVSPSSVWLMCVKLCWAVSSCCICISVQF